MWECSAQEYLSPSHDLCMKSSNDTMRTMRTTLVGVIGTGASFTLERYSLIMAAASATLTALYMLFKCFDWFRLYKKNTKTNEKD